VASQIVAEFLTQADYLREMRSCKESLLYFCRKYAHIEDRKNGRPRLFSPNNEQLLLYKALEENDKVYILKARKRGLTTASIVRAGHGCHFNAGYKAATLTHDDESAEEVLATKMSLLLRRMPEAFFLHDFALRKHRANRVEWNHGAVFRAMTYKSEKVRSSDVDLLHFSEFSAYENVEKVISANENALRPGGKVIYETTARGLGFAFDLWRADNGICKLFFPWTTDPTYAMFNKPNVTQEVWEWAQQYKEDFRIKRQQMHWAAWKMNSYGGAITKLTLHHFNSEYPVTADVAFSVASGRVFQVMYPGARVSTGLCEFSEPGPYRVYTMGVDTATGSPTGDFSAFCILDVTNKEAPSVACTFYDRIPPTDFAEVVVHYAKKYNALVVPERNMGIDVVTLLDRSSYPNVWIEQAYAKVGKKRVPRLGFHTSEMSRKILTGRLDHWLGGLIPKMDPRCPRLQSEINDFVYSDDKRQRPEHMPGKHDDMLFALALALVGMDQAERVRENRTWARPGSIQEMRQYRKVTGKAYDANDQFDADLEDELDVLFGKRTKRGLRGLHKIDGEQTRGHIPLPERIGRTREW